MKKILLQNRGILEIIYFIILLLCCNIMPTFTSKMNYLIESSDNSPSYDDDGCLCLRWTNWINLGNTIDLIHIPQTYESLAHFGKTAAYHEQIDICAVPVSSDCRILVKDYDPNYPDDRYMACPQTKHRFGTEYGWVQMRFLCWDHTCPCLEWSKWYNYDGPRDDGDVEILGKTISYEEFPCPDGTSVFDVECRTAYGKPLSETNNKMLRCDLDGFQCLNDFQEEHCVCEDYMVRFLCLSPKKKELRFSINDFSNVDYPSPPQKIYGYGSCFFLKQCPEVDLAKLAESHLKEKSLSVCNTSDDTSNCEVSTKTKQFGRSFGTDQNESEIQYPQPPEKIYGYGRCYYPKTCPEMDLMKLGEMMMKAAKNQTTVNDITKRTTAMVVTKHDFDSKSTEKSKLEDHSGYMDSGRKFIDHSVTKSWHETKETVANGKEVYAVTKSYENEYGKETVAEREEHYATQPPRYKYETAHYKPIRHEVVYDTAETKNTIAVAAAKHDQKKIAVKQPSKSRAFVADVSNEEEEKAKLMRKPNVKVLRTDDGEQLIIEALPGRAERPPTHKVAVHGPRHEPPMSRKPFHGSYPGFIEWRPPPKPFQPHLRRPYHSYYTEHNYRPYYERPPPPPPRYGQRDGQYKRKYRVRSWHDNQDSSYRTNQRPIRKGYDSRAAYRQDRYEDTAYFHDTPYQRH